MSAPDRQAVRAALADLTAVRRAFGTLGSREGLDTWLRHAPTLMAALTAYADQRPASDEEIDRIIASVWYENVHRDTLCRLVARAMERHHSRDGYGLQPASAPTRRAAMAPSNRGIVKFVTRCVAYLRRHLGGPPADELPPGDIQWQVEDGELILGKPDGKGGRENKGSPNQQWLLVACLLLSADARVVAAAVRFAIQRYRDEQAFGHMWNETMSPSHWWQHLTAHVAIRFWLAGNRGFGPLDDLRHENTAWWQRTAWLLKRFWSPTARREGVNRRGGVVSVGARAVGPGNFAFSSQADELGRFYAGATEIRQPKNEGADTYCQTIAQQLIDQGDDLGRSTPEEPKLLAPIHVSKAGPIASWWEPPAEVSKPSCAVYEDSDGRVVYVFDAMRLPGEFEAVGLGGGSGG